MMRLGYCLFEGPGPGVGPVVAVQDHFGSAFRRFHLPQQPGDILATVLRCGKSTRATDEDGYAPINFKIIRQVHPNTVKAVLRKIGRRDKVLARGYWYEVHAD